MIMTKMETRESLSRNRFHWQAGGIFPIPLESVSCSRDSMFALKSDVFCGSSRIVLRRSTISLEKPASCSSSIPNVAKSHQSQQAMQKDTSRNNSSSSKPRLHFRHLEPYPVTSLLRLRGSQQKVVLQDKKEKDVATETRLCATTDGATNDNDDRDPQRSIQKELQQTAKRRKVNNNPITETASTVAVSTAVEAESLPRADNNNKPNRTRDQIAKHANQMQPPDEESTTTCQTFTAAPKQCTARTINDKREAEKSAVVEGDNSSLPTETNLCTPPLFQTPPPPRKTVETQETTLTSTKNSSSDNASQHNNKMMKNKALGIGELKSTLARRASITLQRVDPTNGTTTNNNNKEVLSMERLKELSARRASITLQRADPTNGTSTNNNNKEVLSIERLKEPSARRASITLQRANCRVPCCNSRPRLPPEDRPTAANPQQRASSPPGILTYVQDGKATVLPIEYLKILSANRSARSQAIAKRIMEEAPKKATGTTNPPTSCNNNNNNKTAASVQRVALDNRRVLARRTMAENPKPTKRQKVSHKAPLSIETLKRLSKQRSLKSQALAQRIMAANPNNNNNNKTQTQQLHQRARKQAPRPTLVPYEREVPNQHHVVLSMEDLKNLSKERSANRRDLAQKIMAENPRPSVCTSKRIFQKVRTRTQAILSAAAKKGLGCNMPMLSSSSSSSTPPFRRASPRPQGMSIEMLKEKSRLRAERNLHQIAENVGKSVSNYIETKKAKKADSTETEQDRTRRNAGNEDKRVGSIKDVVVDKSKTRAAHKKVDNTSQRETSSSSLSSSSLTMEELLIMSSKRAKQKREIAARIIREDEAHKKLEPSNYRFPCPAKKMGPAHNKNTAYFSIPPHCPHGMPLICSHALCRKGRLKFVYCRYCKQPVSRMKFDERHSHPEQVLLALSMSAR